MRFPSWGLSLKLPFCLSFSKLHITYALCLVKVWTPHNFKPWVCTTHNPKSPWLPLLRGVLVRTQSLDPDQNDLIVSWALTDLGDQGSKAWLCSLTFLSSLVVLSFIKLSEGHLHQSCKFNLCVIFRLHN